MLHFSLPLCSFFYIHILIRTQLKTEGGAFAVFQGSLCILLSLFSTPLCKLQPLWLSWTPMSIFPTQGHQQAQPQSLPPATQPGDSLKAIIWDNSRAHLICFLSFKDYCPLLYDVQCLKNYCFICFVQFFSCFCRTVSIAPAIPSWVETAIFPGKFLHMHILQPYSIQKSWARS